MLACIAQHSSPGRNLHSPGARCSSILVRCRVSASSHCHPTHFPSPSRPSRPWRATETPKMGLCQMDSKGRVTQHGASLDVSEWKD